MEVDGVNFNMEVDGYLSFSTINLWLLIAYTHAFYYVFLFNFKSF